MTSTRNRGRGDGLASLSPAERYEAAVTRLSKHLLTPWQRCGQGLDLIIRSGDLEPGGWCTVLGMTALLDDKTDALADIPQVYRRAIVGDALDAVASPDSRRRRRHNHIIDRLPSTKYRGRDLLPGAPALAKDAAARKELRRLGGMAGVSPLVADTVQLRGNGQVELDPEAVRRAMGTWKAQLEREPQPTPEPESTPAPVGEVEAHAHTPLALPPAPAPEPAPVSVVVVVETQPTPEPEPMLINPGAQLDAIIASGRYPDPRDPAEYEAHMERVRRRIAGIL